MLQNNNNFELTKFQIRQIVTRFKEREVVYQEDELLSVADEETLPFIKKVVSESPCVRVVRREFAIDEGYEELAGWSNENDILLLADYDVLICLPKVDYSNIIYG
nr:hypothetical protein [uncultured Bacteroides sp.]